VNRIGSNETEARYFADEDAIRIRNETEQPYLSFETGF
jgi:hypothetical protein